MNKWLVVYQLKSNFGGIHNTIYYNDGPPILSQIQEIILKEEKCKNIIDFVIINLIPLGKEICDTQMKNVIKF